MRKFWDVPLTVVVLWAMSTSAQDGKAALEARARAMGATELNSFEYTASGPFFNFAQAPGNDPRDPARTNE